MKTYQPVVVVVEDNELNATLLRLQLKHLGHDSITFSNGVDALQWLAQNSCDLILTDCQMSPMDGFELTRRLREHEHKWLKATPIVAVTASAMDESMQHALSMGMSDYLIKPVQIAQLSEVLNKWVPKNRQENDQTTLKP